MGNLATYLQNSFIQNCPRDWSCRKEVRLLTPELDEFLGYSSFADVVLEHSDGRRIWIEFEISRADPVANHAKFATGHLFSPQGEGDCFVAMMSSHVQRGRRNLAANTILLMRQIGMSAFQTVLLPQFFGDEIKRLNHLPLLDLPAENLPVGQEIERALIVSKPFAQRKNRRIHLVGDLLEVMLNMWRWNQEVATAEGAALWGKRRVQYFVFDPRTKLFAPSKYCAFTAVPDATSGEVSISKAGMNMALYASLDTPSERLFDGAKAQKHLSETLTMSKYPSGDLPVIDELFNNWSAKHAAQINVDSKGPVFLLPPTWFD